MTKDIDKRESESNPTIKFIPSLEYYFRMYASGMEGNDEKACRVFKEFEPKEKVRRLQNELSWIKNSQVSLEVLERIVGKKRFLKYETYESWAAIMLLWLSK